MVRYIIGGAIIVLLIAFATWQIRRDGQKEYPSPGFGLEFTYPKNYFYEEREVQNGRIITLTEDTEENRALREGRSPVPGEGTVSITIARYDNPDNKGLNEWIRETAESNYNFSNNLLSPVTVGEEPGLRYTWSGLYQGDSIAIKKSDYIYLFTVTYLTLQDRIITDFENLLDTVSIE